MSTAAVADFGGLAGWKVARQVILEPRSARVSGPSGSSHRDEPSGARNQPESTGESSRHQPTAAGGRPDTPELRSDTVHAGLEK